MQASVTVNTHSTAGVRCYAIKIQTDTVEINTAVPFEDAPRLRAVRDTPWLSGALRIGSSAGVPAWWCVGDEEIPKTLSILAGHDDQTWDIAVVLPVDTIDAVLGRSTPAQLGKRHNRNRAA